MILPEYILSCLDALEDAGFAAYAVGGCVRDACLGLQPSDYDLCTAALPEQTEQVFAGHKLVLAGKKHGTIGVCTEGSYRDNRHPDWVEFVPEIEQDLARRDYTINAMAYSPRRGFADPFGGREDLARKQLRAVGDPVRRFSEDSLRILRGVRFAVRYGLEVEPETAEAMKQQAHLMDNLARERVFEELCRLLPLVKAEDLLRFAPVLGAAIPELNPLMGFDQRSPHHAYDLFTHVAKVTGAVPPALPLRWAALLHDIGKIPTFTQDETGRGHFYGHAPAGAEMAQQVLHRLKAPKALTEQVVLLISKHMTTLIPEKKALKRQLGKLGWETLENLLTLQEADMNSKGTAAPEDLEIFPKIRTVLEEIRQEGTCLTLKDLDISGHDLKKMGLEGKQIGQCLDYLLEQVVQEALPNEKPSLLEGCKAWAGEKGVTL